MGALRAPVLSFRLPEMQTRVFQGTPALKGLPASWEEYGLQEARPVGFWSVWWLSEAWSCSWETGIWPKNRQQGPAAAWEFKQYIFSSFHALSLLESSLQAISSPLQNSGLLGSGWESPNHAHLLWRLLGKQAERGGPDCWALHLEREGLIFRPGSEPKTAFPALDYNSSRAKSTARNSPRKTEDAI